MAIDGAMQIEGGNWQIFDSMLVAANATVLLNTTVDGITKENGKYIVKSSSPTPKNGRINAVEESFDTVVLAAPLQFSDIDIEEGLLKYTPDEIPYVTLHVTLFTSPHTLDYGYFNLAETDEVPTTVLTTLPPDEAFSASENGSGLPGFFSLSTLRTVTNPKTLKEERLYKIFSHREITPDFLSNILGTAGKCTPLVSQSTILIETYSSRRPQQAQY